MNQFDISNFLGTQSAPTTQIYNSEGGSYVGGIPGMAASNWVVDPTTNKAYETWTPTEGGGAMPGFKQVNQEDINKINAQYGAPPGTNYSSNDATKQLQWKEYNDYVSTLPDWQQGFYKNAVPYYDTQFRNYAFKPNNDGTYTALKTNVGGSFEDQVSAIQNDPIDQNYFKWTYDPKTGQTSNYEQYDAPGTTGMEYAPYFLAAGTLLSGGLLAPVMAGAGALGGAAIGGGLGMGSNLAGQLIKNQGEIKDWSGLAMSGLTGAASGAFAGGGGLKGLFGGGSEFVMSPETSSAFGMEAYPSSWEGSIYGTQQGLMDATGSASGWVSPWDTMGDAAGYAAEEAASSTEIDKLIQIAQATETPLNVESLTKKFGIKAAKEMMKKLLNPQPEQPRNAATAVRASAPSNLGNLYASTPSSASIPSMDINQKLLEYKQAQLDPEYWRFMSTGEEA